MKLLTIEETADALSVHPNTVRKLLAKLGAVDLNGGRSANRLIRIPEKNIEAYLRECTIYPPVSKRQARPTYCLERRRA